MRASRRDILKSAATMAAARALAANAATVARAKEPAAPAAGAFRHVDTALRAATGAGELPGIVAMAATESGVVYEGIFGTRRFHDGPSRFRPRPEERGQRPQDRRASAIASPSAAEPTAPSMMRSPITQPGVPSMPMRAARARLALRKES